MYLCVRLMCCCVQEAEQLLGDNRPDPDAGTRGQQKKIEEINSPPPAKKSKKSAPATDLKKGNTIDKTVQEGKNNLYTEQFFIQSYR